MTAANTAPQTPLQGQRLGERQRRPLAARRAAAERDEGAEGLAGEVVEVVGVVEEARIPDGMLAAAAVVKILVWGAVKAAKPLNFVLNG